MPTYKNLPTNRLELLDGNLIVDTPIEGNVVLVIGTAYSGPTGKQVLMNDSNLARKIYGAGSPLLQKAAEAKLGGAKNILLYRIGGQAASINGLFGTDTYIRTVDETATAGSDYSIYIGPQPSAPATACLIVFQGAKIVYSNVTGSEVDLGKVIVEGFDPTFVYKIGTPTSPVALASALANVVSTTTLLAAGVLNQVKFDLPVPTTSTDTTKATSSTAIEYVKVNGTTKTPATDYNLSIGTGTGGLDEVVFTAAPAAGSAIEIKFSRAVASFTTSTGTGTGAEKKFDIAAVSGTVNSSPLTIVESVTVAGTSSTNYTLSIGTGTGGLDEIIFGTAPTVGQAVVIRTRRPISPVVDSSYVAGANNIGASWQKLYELLDSAYIDLETTIATEAVVDQAILDAPNVADGSTASNKLLYFRKYADSSDQPVYEWSTSKIHYKQGSGTTTNIGSANLDANGQPIVAKQFAEVNFAHQFGEFLNSLTENDRFVLGFIGTSAPVSYSSAKIAAWIGTSPEVDSFGTIVGNGTGLLGNKFHAGTTSRIAGFYKTDTGYPDGIPQQDSNGAYIDLGKFLSVVPGLVTLPTSPSAGTNGQVVNGAGVYAGLATTITPGNSTTNEVVPRVGTPFVIKKPKLDDLSNIGYVVFQDKDRGTVVVSGELATNVNSDYDYISTSIIVRDLTNSIRTRLDGYLGKGIDGVKIAAMQTAVDGVMRDGIVNGLIKKYAATVIPTSTFGVTIPYTIVPVFELRDINNVVKLAYDV